MKRARIIYNPTSGRGKILENLINIIKIYEKAGYETSIFETTPAPFSACKEAKRAAKTGFDLLIAAGGDGTVNEVVNGIADLKNRPIVAIIPAGTTNDYARALKIPRNDLVRAAQIINKKETIKMDIGKIISKKAAFRYFMNIGALGTLAEISYAVPSTLKTLYGYLAYLTKGVELFTRIKSIPVKINYDHGYFKGEAELIFLSLTNSVGGFEKVFPKAKLDDGNFNLLIVKKTNLLELFNLVTAAFNDGSHIKSKFVEYKKTKKAEIIPLTKDKIKVNLDGELGGYAPMKFENLQQHIRFIASTSEINPTAFSSKKEVRLK